MAPATLEGPRLDVIKKISLDRVCSDLLEEVAAAAFDGNVSAAVRHLVRVHAGLEAERAGEVEPVDVDAWRRRALTMELVREVAGLIRAGSVRVDAYRIAGVVADQADGWDKRGRSDAKAGRVTTHAQWVMMLARAEAEYKLEELADIKDGKWKLERSYPAEYGRKSTSDQTVTHRHLPMIDFERLTVSEARALVELLRKASPGADDQGISSRARPIGELLPADVDGEAHEV